MNPNILTTAISTAGAVITAVVALVLNQRGFTSLENQIRDLRGETNRRFERIEADLKEFFKAQTEFDKRLGRIEDKLNLK